MNYLAVKTLHVTTVAASITLFVLRYALDVAGVAWRDRLWLRIGPHVIDTILLGSALWLSMSLAQYPFVHNWLTAKVLALFVYIGAGSMALRVGNTPRARAIAFAVAVTAVIFILGAALRHSARSWFA